MVIRLSRAGLAIGLVAVLAVTMSSTAGMQNVASNKAFFTAGDGEVLILATGDVAAPILTGTVKTSSVGDLLIGVSMECALWTGTKNSGSKGGGNTNSVSRAAVNITVTVDNIPATPEQVVFCDRQQEVNLEFESNEVVATDAITLELFLTTKNANHFNFFVHNPGNAIHTVRVYASGIVTADPDAPAGSTHAAIGERTLSIEEYNSAG